MARTRIALIAVIATTLAGLARAQTASSPAAVAAGRYHCVFFVNGSLQTTPGFTLLTGGTYRHDDGTAGRYIFDRSEALVTFEGGSLDKQAAQVAQATRGGLLSMYNERRTRTVIDCDTPGP